MLPRPRRACGGKQPSAQAQQDSLGAGMPLGAAHSKKKNTRRAARRLDIGSGSSVVRSGCAVQPQPARPKHGAPMRPRVYAPSGAPGRSQEPCAGMQGALEQRSTSNGMASTEDAAHTDFQAYERGTHLA